ncbi:MAG TPA: pyrroloquinoline quinone biosynthesis peptide chaperone PqqD [Xanthobacteraceae bacterium]|nr:pyrroloquinoline quinone biosynthesis peptide chaperone PqqD [Xanthobacteraceae bacterium]
MTEGSRTVADDSVPRLPRGVRLIDSPAHGGTVLLAPERAFKPDAIALAILQRCDGTTTIAAIADHLSATYAAPRERVLADIKALLGSLADKKLLEL